MQVLIIDNYDSFTYNLFQYVGEITGIEPLVFLNDRITPQEAARLQPDRIIISPGPGTPYEKRDRGNCAEIIRAFCARVPILGICMGHQIIAYTFGGSIIRHARIMHGKTSRIILNESPLFSGLSSPLTVMRYHSLAADPGSLPDCFRVIAEVDEDRTIMGIAHKEYPLFGLQFHPESIGTEGGKTIIANFIALQHQLYTC